VNTVREPFPAVNHEQRMRTLKARVQSCRVAEQGCGAGGLGAEPSTFKSGGLIYKIAPPHFLCPKKILQGPFWSHKRNYSIKKLVYEG